MFEQRVPLSFLPGVLRTVFPCATHAWMIYKARFLFSKQKQTRVGRLPSRSHCEVVSVEALGNLN